MTGNVMKIDKKAPTLASDCVISSDTKTEKGVHNVYVKVTPVDEGNKASPFEKAIVTCDRSKDKVNARLVMINSDSSYDYYFDNIIDPIGGSSTYKVKLLDEAGNESEEINIGTHETQKNNYFLFSKSDSTTTVDGWCNAFYWKENDGVQIERHWSIYTPTCALGCYCPSANESATWFMSPYAVANPNAITEFNVQCSVLGQLDIPSIHKLTYRGFEFDVAGGTTALALNGYVSGSGVFKRRVPDNGNIYEGAYSSQDGNVADKCATYMLDKYYGYVE